MEPKWLAIAGVVAVAMIIGAYFLLQKKEEVASVTAPSAQQQIQPVGAPAAAPQDPYANFNAPSKQ